MGQVVEFCHPCNGSDFDSCGYHLGNRPGYQDRHDFDLSAITTTMSEEKKWYVVRTAGGKEKKAKEYIESEVAKRGWQELVTQVLIPTEKVVSQRNGKKVIKERNYFPGYVLVEAVLLDEVVPVIQNVPNVLDWLREPSPKGKIGRPIPMRTEEINRILGNMDETVDTGENSMDKFLVGQSVKVIEGPFASFSGIVEEVNEEKRKLKVTVKIFGRKTPLELNFSQVEEE